MSDKAIAVASEVCNRIYQAGQFDFDDGRDWYDQASSQIALAAGDAPILYVDHNMNAANNDNSKAMIVAFTEDLLIIADLKFMAGSTRRGQIVGTRVIGRKSLSALTVGRVTNAIGYSHSEWPKSLSVKLGYGSDELVLPFRSFGGEIAKLATLIPSLAKDLNA